MNTGLLKSILLLCACLVLPAQADIAHKWVDADGVTHYSDEPPADAAAPATAIELPAAGRRATSPGDDYYSIANQWQRMHQERLERDRIALEKARLRAAREAAGSESPPPAQPRYVVETHGRVYPRRPYRWYGNKRHGYKTPVGQGKFPPGLHPGRNLGVGGYQQ